MENEEKRTSILSDFRSTDFIEEQLKNLNNVSDWIACAAEEYGAKDGATKQLYNLAIIKMNLRDLKKNIEEKTVLINEELNA